MLPGLSFSKQATDVTGYRCFAIACILVAYVEVLLNSYCSFCLIITIH